MKAALAVVLAWSSLAAAEPRFADEWYREGEDRYNLGKFEEAAAAFKRGFELEPSDNKKPAYIYNVAQSYRQANKCKDAVVYYRRFLALEDSGLGQPLAEDKRKEIETTVGGLEMCARNQDAAATVKPEVATAKVSAAGGDAEDDDGDREVRTPAVVGPTRVVASVALGGSKVTAGGLDVPLQPAVSIVAGYPIAVAPQLRVDVGVAIGLTSLPYTSSITSQSTAGSLTRLLADAGATYAVAPKVGLRGDLGLGVMLLRGADQPGNPFTQMGEQSSGTLAMFAVRAAASADYQVTPNIVATVTPLAVSYSPALSGLRSDITSITSLEFLIGVGYRM